MKDFLKKNHWFSEMPTVFPFNKLAKICAPLSVSWLPTLKCVRVYAKPKRNNDFRLREDYRFGFELCLWYWWCTIPSLLTRCLLLWKNKSDDLLYFVSMHQLAVVLLYQLSCYRTSRAELMSTAEKNITCLFLWF